MQLPPAQRHSGRHTQRPVITLLALCGFTVMMITISSQQQQHNYLTVYTHLRTEADMRASRQVGRLVGTHARTHARRPGRHARTHARTSPIMVIVHYCTLLLYIMARLRRRWQMNESAEARSIATHRHRPDTPRRCNDHTRQQQQHLGGSQHAACGMR
eukprot:GHVU01036461.1.p1 GENE.GHVU01036461.1~~GHVU01036461.1.p1  ORF type:complete len:158 (+),score=12.77 GHVU01036461.1:21-494(+)